MGTQKKLLMILCVIFACVNIAFQDLHAPFDEATDDNHEFPMVTEVSKSQHAHSFILRKSKELERPSFKLELSTARTSQECRLEWDLEKKFNLTNQWLERELPILISAIRDDRTLEKDHSHRRLSLERMRRGRIKRDEIEQYHNFTEGDVVYITLTQKHCRQREQVMDFWAIPWNCLYGKKTTGDPLDISNVYGIEVAMMAPRHMHDGIIHFMCKSTMDDSNLILRGVSPSTRPEQNKTE